VAFGHDVFQALAKREGAGPKGLIAGCCQPLIAGGDQPTECRAKGLNLGL